ncbi:MAG TPA: nicotinate-nucleotide adenylyltransferase [Bacteroidota bacterium]|nr:nicotinate-nucleotide adenylyltransferase [Bacteroidota bacterium]
MKLGIFGGSFNPPHNGHLIVAQSVQDQLKLDKIVFVPCASPPHKLNARLAPADSRLAMTAMAVQGNGRFEASDAEVRRGGVSYTVDTLKYFLEIYSRAELFLIIGIDNYLEFHTWRSPEEIMDLAELVVMNREGYTNDLPSRAATKRVRFVDVPSIGISGTMIRLHVRTGRQIRYLVPADVENYIKNYHLYKD